MVEQGNKKKHEDSEGKGGGDITSRRDEDIAEDVALEIWFLAGRVVNEEDAGGHSESPDRTDNRVFAFTRAHADPTDNKC